MVVLNPDGTHCAMRNATVDHHATCPDSDRWKAKAKKKPKKVCEACEGLGNMVHCEACDGTGFEIPA
jgi:hypothetical protein